HRPGEPLGERLHRGLQCPLARRAAQRRDLLYLTRGPDRRRELAASLQHDQAARLAWIQTACTGGVHSGPRRVAGCATSNGFAGHAGATASLKLTFEVDHSAVANHLSDLCSICGGGCFIGRIFAVRTWPPCLSY